MGLIRGIARTAVVAGTATAVSNRVSHRQQQRWAERSYAEQPPPEAPPAPPPGDDLTARLDQLSALRDSGRLTPEEFAAAKAKLLGI